jgi:hypothetical protein
MKKILPIILVSILSINCFSQIIYEKGYYINNADQKVNCLIKNKDWKNNPIEFEYKLSENDDSKKLGRQSVKEFGIYNRSRYISSTVDIDRSNDDVNNLSSERNPTFEKEELFLKVLVEGRANLYLYKQRNLVRFFYSKDDSKIDQLVYKSYLSNNRVAENNAFKSQLWRNLKCQKFSFIDISKINHDKIELVNLFVVYNQCVNSEFVNFEEKDKKDLFNLTFRPRINSSSLSIENFASKSSSTDFDRSMDLGMGIEAEFIMPFNNGKWSVIIEPTYLHYKSEKELKTQDVVTDYKSIELPIGIRHYFFINTNSKIFINGSYSFNFAGDSKIVFESIRELDIAYSTNLGFGMGYKYKDKVGVELRYQTPRELLIEYGQWNSDFNKISMIFGYSIF